MKYKIEKTKKTFISSWKFLCGFVCFSSVKTQKIKNENNIRFLSIGLCTFTSVRN